ncbi:Sec-independent protein translocase subunit TatA [Kluyvera sp. NPDC087067]|uniref:Sec-independent protein translocase subunit TatA n=1 Tax=unclassified Kluyvera TaxID=2619995 RepID=UPI003803D95A
MGEISITKLLVIVVLVILLFGTKKLATLGSDVGAALKGFKKAMNDDNKGDDADFLNSQSTTDEATKADSTANR